MRHIWITLAYDGTRYAGFQRQENKMTVQEMAEEAILSLTGVRSTLYFVARTDAGVHAFAQECTFYTDSSIPAERFYKALNTRLPPDIRVTRSCERDMDFSVRRTNFGKTYGYLMTEERETTPFLYPYVWRVGHTLSTPSMEEAARYLIGTHDFTSFRGNNSVPSSPIRRVHDIRIEREGSLVRLFVTGDGFLYHMVRNIAGTLAACGSGELDPKEIPGIFERQDRRFLPAVTAPAKGLALLSVYFSPIDRKAIDAALARPLFPWTK